MLIFWLLGLWFGKSNGQSIGLDYTCTPSFDIGDISIPEICFGMDLDVCAEQLSVQLDIDGENVVSEEVSDFEDFEVCQPIEECDVCIRTDGDVVVTPAFVEVCLESFSRCTEWGVEIELGQTSLGCIQQGQECEQQYTCGDCVSAGCGWCGDSCLPLLPNLDDEEPDVWCDSCEQDIILECASSAGEDEEGENGVTPLTDRPSVLILVISASVALSLGLVCLAWRRCKKSQRSSRTHQPINGDNLDSLSIPQAIELDLDGSDDDPDVLSNVDL